MKNKLIKFIALCLAINLIIEPVLGAAAHALTSGPKQPEFSSFEPVTTTNMVNEFTGDFTYNLPVLEIPGPDGSGYALSLSYHSGTSPEEEASWVGYGWTVNPGAIIRNKRGFPDDYKAQNIIYWNKVPDNYTVSVGVDAGLEVFSVDEIGASLSASLRYNNYKGFGSVAGLGAHVKGIINFGYSVEDGESNWSVSINPANIVNSIIAVNKSDEKTPASDENSPRRNRPFSSFRVPSSQANLTLGSSRSRYSVVNTSDVVRPTNIVEYSGFSVNVSVSGEPTLSVPPIGVEFGFSGNFTIQSQTNDNLSASGYMYSSTPATEIMDYFLEKDLPYQKRNNFLALPFGNADYFMGTGEGIIGGFRLYNKKAGHFRPNRKSSGLLIFQAGVEVQAGSNIGLGLDLGVGYQDLEVKNWSMPSEYQFASAAQSTDEPFFFRFSNDLGGSVLFSGNDAAVNASIGDLGLQIPGTKDYRAEISDNIWPSMNQGTNQENKRSGRSSYIAYHTNAEMAEGVFSPNLDKLVNYKAYTKDQTSRKWVKRDRSSENSTKDGIGEIVIFNESGEKYAYGLPVYSRNEKNLQYGLDGARRDIRDNYLAYRDISIIEEPFGLRLKIGEERPVPYATTFLLTEITTPDYIDRRLDGPTPDDFGGYTKFNYRMIYGTPGEDIDSNLRAGYKHQPGNWYKWRIPYTGLLYEKNELSNPEDDLGVVIAGEKEIYYLESIETKTHVAEFITSDSDRLDGIDAAENEEAARGETARGTNTLKQLEKIKLYAKQTDGNPSKLIKTTRFEYDYSLMKGLPNAAIDPATGSKAGKLTLKKVWFEYEGILNARISPYVFGYEYRNFAYPARYENLLDGYSSFTPQDQNPDYDAKNIDRWGNYQLDGGARHAILNPWVDQTPDPRFDPAAWQLKSIKLPSGGEIHVQYEQDDYAYVQDRPVMAMVSLKRASIDTDDKYKYYLNVSDLGIVETSGATDECEKELDKLRCLIQRHFIDNYPENKQKMYFKFLYALIGSGPDINKCNSEYIGGYAKVAEVGIDPQEGDLPDELYVKLSGVPKTACEEFVNKTRNGKIREDDCSEYRDPIEFVTSPPPTIASAMSNVLTLLALAPTIPTLLASEKCTQVNFGKSYLRVPMTRAKKGGGIRVKRLLMYDQGLETDQADKVLYGNEYVYETRNGDSDEIISSGVATNEPSGGREENALVSNITRYTYDDNLLAGEKLKQDEGPIGESLLPAPTVGYSKVIVKNIHSGKTNTGIVVHEFFTANDYSFDKNYRTIAGSAVNQTIINKERDKLELPLGFINRFVDNMWLSQGSRFVINNMHGQRKTVATYSADYGDVHDRFETSLISRQDFRYFDPGEAIPVMYGLGDIRNEFPGKEMEVVFETKAMEDETYDFNLEGDASLGLAGLLPIPFVTGWPSWSYYEYKTHTHVTTKVVRYPAILKSIRTYQDGVYTFSENVAFDPATGNPIQTRTVDGYHGLGLNPDDPEDHHKGNYYTYNFPAYQEYSSMGQKAENERTILKSTDLLTVKKVIDENSNPFLELTASDGTVCEDGALKRFYPGDLVDIKYIEIIHPPDDPTGIGREILLGQEICHVDKVIGNRVALLPTYNYATRSIIPSGVQVLVEIIRSGRTNQLKASTGSLTTYGIDAIEREPREPIDHPIPQEILRLRRQLAINLNNLLQNPVGGYLDIPNGVTLLDKNGNCIEPSEPMRCIKVSHEWPEFPGPLRTDLNFNCLPDTCANRMSRSTHWQLDRFDYDESTGQLVYFRGDNDCFPVPVTCIRFCPEVYPYQTMNGVIATSLQTFSDDWDIRGTPLGQAYDIPTETEYNLYEIGGKGKWRPKSTFTYLSDIISANDPATAKVYKDAGVFRDFTLFNWKYQNANDPTKWLKTNTITLYSPNGNPLEDQNMRGIKSAAKYGYHHTVPYLVAQNADYYSVDFESFENIYAISHFEDGLAYDISSGPVIDPNISHAGSQSLKFTAPDTSLVGIAHFRLKEMELTEQIQEHGLSLKMWVKSANPSAEIGNHIILRLLDPEPLPEGTVFLEIPMSKVAKTGEWALYEAAVKTFNTDRMGRPFIPVIRYTNTFSEPIWIDDIRVQPLDAQMTAYVYDSKTLRLLTSFDDQHFGLYYQYNAEGKLVRKIIETERGMKTIQEMQYHTPQLEFSPPR